MHDFAAVYLVLENGFTTGRVLTVKDPIVGQFGWDVDPPFERRVVNTPRGDVAYAACRAIEGDRFLGRMPGWSGGHAEANNVTELDAAMSAVAETQLELNGPAADPPRADADFGLLSPRAA